MALMCHKKCSEVTRENAGRLLKYFRGERSGKGAGAAMTSDVSPLTKDRDECAARFRKRNKKGSKRINLMLPRGNRNFPMRTRLSFPRPVHL